MQFRGLHTDNRFVYIFMDYMKLGDLEKYIDFIWEEDDTKLVVQQLLSGLSFMHENRITHRDLKPPVRIKFLEPSFP